MIVGQEIQQTQNSIKTTKNNQVWYIKRNYAQLYLNVSVNVSVIFKSGDGRTIRAISCGSVEYCNILIMSAKSIVRYYSVYLQNSKFLRNFLRKFKCRVSYYGCKILLRRESK